LDFHVRCIRGAPSYNLGFLDAQFELADANVAIYESDDLMCELRFQFNRFGVDLTQSLPGPACGFGAGVSATGAYVFKSDETPNIPRRGGEPPSIP
jgi:hypothetical protein